MLVFRSLEPEECPTKGSTARVAKDERIPETALRTENATIQALTAGIAHLRLAEVGRESSTYLEVSVDVDN
jgi:hypothetical protein